MKTIKTVLIGAGYRGMRLYHLMRAIPQFNVVAVFDPCCTPEVDSTIACYGQDAYAYLTMLDECKPQLVVIASPWQFHVEQTCQCLQRGGHVALEIKGGFSLGEYQQAIEMAHQKNLHLFPLENTVFMRENMALYNMVKEGVLGELVAMRGGYRHDLRDMLVDETGNWGNSKKPEGIWRSKFYQYENGDLYPTHGLAPLCLAAGINREDYMVELMSFSSRACGLKHFIREKGGDDSVNVAMGDIVVTQLKSAKGILFTLTHDTTLPRPRSLDFEIQGTKGIWRGEFRKIYIEGLSPYEEWEDDFSYIERFEHDFWKKWGTLALKYDTHHSGMDYIMLRALVANLLDEAVYPILPEDLALWTSVTPYSKLSISQGRVVKMRE